MCASCNFHCKLSFLLRRCICLAFCVYKHFWSLFCYCSTAKFDSIVICEICRLIFVLCCPGKKRQFTFRVKVCAKDSVKRFGCHCQYQYVQVNSSAAKYRRFFHFLRNSFSNSCVSMMDNFRARY